MIIKRGLLEILNLDFLPDGLEKKEIMVEHSVSIKFELSDYVKLEKGDFIIHDEKHFSLNKDFIPVINKSTNGFIYDLKFYDKTERFKDFKLKFQLGTVDELDFKLTTSGDKFLDIVIYSLHKHGLGTFTKGQFPSEIKEIHFKNVDIFSGLNQIANEYGLEWWIDGTILNLGKLEYGEPVLLRNDIELEDISFSPSSEKLITRLYAFGSSRNIQSNYRINEAVGDIAERRLRLPIGTEYVDLFHDLPENQVVEGVHVFEDIYPRQKNTIIDVLTNDVSGTVIYTFKGDNTFTITHDDIIAGKPLKIAFQSGLLAGKDFDLIIRDNNYFEIRYEQSGDVYLPNMTLKPQVGDEFFFFNFKADNVLPVLITQAENELLTQAQRFLDKIGSEYVYTTKNRSIHCEENGIDLDVGQVVTLQSETIGSVTSRIRGYEKNLYNKFECTLTVGDYSKYSRLKELGRDIEKIADSPDHPDILNIYTTLREWSADGIISPTEKLAIKQTRQRIIVEHESVIASAEKYNLSVDDYQLAWDAYDQVLEKYSAEIPEHIPIEEDFGIAEETYKSEKIAIDNAIINAQKAEISSKQPSGSYLTWGEFDELFEINRNPITGEIESVGVHHPFYGKHEISAYGIGEVSDNDGGSLSLLSDVQLINPVQGQILRFNGTHWVNETLSVSTSWNDLADKPSTFAPSPHFHIVSDITNLQTVLDSKASISHDHDTLYTKVGHGHTVSDISDFPIAWAWSKLSGVPTAISGTTVSFTTSLKSKLDGIASGADVNVQADWNVTDSTSDAFIKNKPTSLPASDVYAWAKSTTKPTYSFSELGGKPTTLIGYGIADAYTKTEVNSALASKLDKSVFDDLFVKVNKGTEAAPIWAIEAKYNFYSIGEVAAYGFGSDGGGGESYNRLDAWTDYNTDKSGWVLSAFLGDDLNTRLSNVEGGSATDVTTTGTGNAITSISKAGTVITATKGATFSLDNHLHAGIYEPVFSKNTAFNKNFGTTSGTVAQGNDSRINNGQTAYGWGNHASAGYALNSSLNNYLPLTGGTLTGNLATPYTAGSWISLATRTNIITPTTANSASSAHALFRLENSTGDRIAFGGLGVNVGFYGYTAARISAGTNATDWSTYWNVNTGLLTHTHSVVFGGTVTAPTFIGALTGNADTATKLQTARTLTIGNTGKTFDGTANVAWSLAEIGALPLTGGTMSNTNIVTNLNADLLDGLHASQIEALNAGYLRVIQSNTGNQTWLPDDNSVDSLKLKVYDVYAQAGTPSTYGNVLEINGIANHWKPQLWFDGSSHNIRYRNRGYNSTTWLPWKLIAFTDSNVASATKLQSARTLTIGSTGKTFDGTANVTWSLAEIGALPLTGGNLTGALAINLGASASYPLSLTSAGVTTNIGSLNSTWCHFNTTATTGFYFYKNIQTPLDITAKSFIGALSGNASSATKLQTARNIAGVAFNGTADIAIPFANLSSKPTTLSGYGITDAAPISHSNTSGELTIHHTHSNKTNLNTINQAMATTNTVTFAANILTTFSKAPKFDLGNGWTIEASGAEIHFKLNGVVKGRFLDGAFVSTGEITAYG